MKFLKKAEWVIFNSAPVSQNEHLYISYRSYLAIYQIT